MQKTPRDVSRAKIFRPQEQASTPLTSPRNSEKPDSLSRVGLCPAAMSCPPIRLNVVPVNPELQGRVFPPVAPYLVGREKIREFARAVQSTSPLHHDVSAASAAGFADLVAPPTFAVVVQEATLAQLLAEPDAGIDFRLVVHGEQRFTYSRPIVAGDELTANLTVSSVKTLGGNAMVTAESVMTDARGAHVVTAVSTLVVRGDA